MAKPSLDAVKAAKEIVLAWLGTTEMKGSGEYVAEQVNVMLDKVAQKFDELTQR